ncbi:accessory factor UbiK family protein [Marinobacterium jannaschii]|uniref:accessory factor UbiK family protein n=1 Tax=Marinobacterium jannaschii TaxID=64970 RepID=UPI0004817F22|nr:accessory factor UbiK family protein [Marinobacterium jannaschii]
MINQKLIEGLTEQFSQLMSGQGALPGQEAMKQQISAILQGTFNRMDLVTRDEFDAQALVLQRTREKLDALEQQIATLETAMEQQGKQDS